MTLAADLTRLEAPVLCENCARMVSEEFPGFRCEAYRGWTPARQECWFFRSLAGHPVAEIVRAVQMGLQGAEGRRRSERKAITPEWRAQTATLLLGRSLVARGYPVTARLTRLYLVKVLTDPILP